MAFTVSRANARSVGSSESLVWPYVMEEGYRQMAADVEREAEAMEWVEGTSEEVGDEARCFIWDYSDILPGGATA